MSDQPIGVRLARRWAAAYTRGLPSEIGDRRRGEIECDLWEHLNDPGTADREILGRLLRGIHADVWWRYRTLLELRGARTRSHVMSTTSHRNWWRVAAAALGVFAIASAILAGVTGATGDVPLALLIGAIGTGLVGGTLVLAGLARQTTDPASGSRLVIAGAIVVAVSEPLLIVVAALVVIAGLWTGRLSPTESVAGVVAPPGSRQATLTRHWYRWLVGGAAMAAVSFVVLLVWDRSGLVPTSCTETNPCWEDTAAWATWMLTTLAALVLGGIGAVLGALRLVTRHHTRLPDPSGAT